MRIGYARVSTLDQNPEFQLEKLRDPPSEWLFAPEIALCTRSSSSESAFFARQAFSPRAAGPTLSYKETAPGSSAWVDSMSFSIRRFP
jgi:hypothetical protein